MNKDRRKFLLLAAACIAIALVCLTALLVRRNTADATAHTAAERDAASGTDFLLEGQPVRVHVDIEPTRINIGDSITFVMRVEGLPGVTSAERRTIGNVFGGSLQPALSPPEGCQTSPNAAIPIPTRQQLPQFNWAWTIGCSTPGEKAVQASLAFTTTGSPNGSAILSYHSQTYFTVTDPLSQQILGTLTIVSSLVGVLSGLKGLFAKPAESRVASG